MEARPSPGDQVCSTAIIGDDHLEGAIVGGKPYGGQLGIGVSDDVGPRSAAMRYAATSTEDGNAGSDSGA